MLYRQPSFSLGALLRATFTRVADAFAEAARTNADSAYLDSLTDHQLRDLGVRRLIDRDETRYR